MATESKEAFHQNLMNFLKMPSVGSIPRALLAIRRQLIHICLGNETVPKEYLDHLKLEPVSDKTSVLVNEVGMLRHHVNRFLETDFETSRKSSVANNESFKDDFERFLSKEENSDLAIRVRDQYRVPNHDEPVRARIVKKPWRTLYDEFLTERREANVTPVGSKNSLRKIVKKYFRNYRRPTPGDRRYAECSTCANLTLLIANAKKSDALKTWSNGIDKEQLLKLTVCPDPKYDCEWNQCQECTFDRTVEKIRATIGNFNEIKDRTICFQTLVSYNAKSNCSATTFMESCDTVEEFTVELARSMFSAGSGGCGSKVKLSYYLVVALLTILGLFA